MRCFSEFVKARFSRLATMRNSETYGERTIGCLHKNRRLSVRYEKRADFHEAFLTLGCIIVCFHFVEYFVRDSKSDGTANLRHGAGQRASS